MEICVRQCTFISGRALNRYTRTTWGLFHDVAAANGQGVTARFGHVFGALVGRLLRSVCPPDQVWRDAEGHGHGKRGDWAYVGRDRTVLIDAKSARPTPELTCKGSEEGVGYAANKIADALVQLSEQDVAIQHGEWRAHGLPPGPVVQVVVTYGQYSSLNGPWFRRRIEQKLRDKRAHVTSPYVVLSIQEFDAVIRLVERGHRLDEIMAGLTAESCNPLNQHGAELRKDAVSSLAVEHYERLMRGLP